MVDSFKVVRYKNAKVVKPGKPLPVLDELWVQRGKIIDPQKYFYDIAKRADEEVDCKGLILAPGYIDIQCNGELSWFNYKGVFLQRVRGARLEALSKR